MSFMKNIFGKGKKKEEKEEGKSVRFKENDWTNENGNRQSIAFADRSFGEESLSAYAKSVGKRTQRGPQSLPGGPRDTRSMGRDTRSVITSNHQKYKIDFSPENHSFHVNRVTRNQRKREHRPDLDLSLSDQENNYDTRRMEGEWKVEKYRRQVKTQKEEIRKLKDENERLKKENEKDRERSRVIIDQFSEINEVNKKMKKELKELRNTRSQYGHIGSLGGPLSHPSTFPFSHGSIGHDTFSSRSSSVYPSSIDQDRAGESIASPLNQSSFFTRPIPPSTITPNPNPYH
ncbi:hypothetical protein PENTCL1PPCAC_6388 [Pristionchus entomophagus]|uniref:Uncharacterized protein n=1 Tax=Pristionchus entomophagus TaxID=358040 RepID=A0AAV5SM88_9BILA|nr:hypothetical protein PENTCL1PPCAC_6388 [Pristionchus entomophagus]